ncbi:MAG: hypothetical protein QXU24_00235 [Ignisphaera sp.]
MNEWLTDILEELKLARGDGLYIIKSKISNAEEEPSILELSAQVIPYPQRILEQWSEYAIKE